MRVSNNPNSRQVRPASSNHPFLSFLRSTGLILTSTAVLTFFGAKAIAQPDALPKQSNLGTYRKVLNSDEKQRIERNIYRAVVGTDKGGAFESLADEAMAYLAFKYMGEHPPSTVEDLTTFSRLAALVGTCEFPEEVACAAMDMVLKAHAGARGEQDAWRRRDPDLINRIGAQNDLSIADTFFGLFTTLAEEDLLPCEPPDALGTKYKKALLKQRDNSTYWRDSYNRQKFPEPGHITIYLKGDPGKAAASCDMALGILQAAEPFIVGNPAIYNHMVAIKEPILRAHDRVYSEASIKP